MDPFPNMPDKRDRVEALIRQKEEEARANADQ